MIMKLKIRYYICGPPSMLNAIKELFQNNPQIPKDQRGIYRILTTARK
jgi:NAD(P)H-flavin reductase